MQITAPTSKTQLWAGYVLTALPTLFLVYDGVLKIFKPAFVIELTVKLGYSESVIIPLGVVLTLCAILYALPRTTTLGAILLTGYLGGAVATQVRAGDGWFPTLFPVVIGMFIWGGLYLRDERARGLIPLSR